MKNILWIAGLVGLMGQSEAGISKKNTGNGIEMIIKRVRDYSRNTSGTKGKIFFRFLVAFFDFYWDQRSTDRKGGQREPSNSTVSTKFFDQPFRQNFQ